MKLTKRQEQIIRSAYRKVGVPVDQLPYTREFTEIMDLLRPHSSSVNPRNVWVTLRSLRKAGKLPKFGRRKKSK